MTDPVSGHNILKNLAATRFSSNQFKTHVGHILDYMWNLSIHAFKLGVLSSFVQRRSLPFLTAVPASSKARGKRCRSHDVRSGEVGVEFCHLDVGVPEQLGKLVEIAARHHVPGSKRVAQIVEPKVSDLRSFEEFIKTLVRTLTPTGCA